MSDYSARLDAALQQVQLRIGTVLADSNPLVAKYVNAVGRSRGKRIRPRLLLALASSRGTLELSGAVNCAACCELLHTASLIHDDVIDEADIRRGEATLNHRFGNEIAVIVGDYVLSLLLQSLLDERDFTLLELLISTSKKLGLGVIQEINERNSFALGEEQYYEMIYLKTAALFSLCCQMGAYLSGADKHQQELAVEYGRLLGLAFQVVDDLLDLTQDSANTGKPALNDVREGRVTLPYVHAYANAPEQTSRLYMALQRLPAPAAEAALREHLEQLGSIRYAFVSAQGLLEQARGIALQLSSGDGGSLLDGELERIERQVLQALPLAASTVL